jgi:long-chain acyl-CoA synthetase
VTTASADNLSTLLLSHPFGDDELLLHGVDESITAGEAKRRALALGSDLVQRGLAPGGAVAMQLPNGPDVLITMFAVWLAGGVVVTINPRAPRAELDDMLAATEPVMLIDGDGVHAFESARRYDAGVAFVVWTSGTTGRPKPILHTHEGYLELLDRVLTPLRGSTPKTADPSRKISPNLIPVSLALNAGIYNALFGLRAGAPLVIMDRFEPGEFADLVSRFEIRSTVLPPAAIAMLSDEDAVADLAPLRYVRSITASLSPLQAKRFSEKFGVVVLNGYGQAEIGEVIGWTATDAREHPENVGAVGRPHPGVRIKIVDGAGRPVAAGDVGVLRVRTASMATSYASGEELDDRLDSDGFVDTGDYARQADDGFVWIEGRASDLINRGGNKIFPEQVEDVLGLLPGVSEAAVVGVPDERLGQVPVAFLAGSGAPDETLEGICRQHLTPYKVPVAYHWVDHLPRSEIGKVLRRDLVEQHERTHRSEGDP